MFNKVTLSGALAIIVGFGNYLIPILPPVWGNLIAALLALYTTYYGHRAVTIARGLGAKGI